MECNICYNLKQRAGPIPFTPWKVQPQGLGAEDGINRCMMTKEMGVNTWASFAGTDDNAVVDGDFAVIEDELQPVLKSLRSSDINIVAIHYWGRGSVEKLTSSLKKALAAQKAVPAPVHDHSKK